VTRTDRRSEILDVAKEIFSERGIKATTVRQIGSSAGILSGSLYHHFGSKLDIVDAILRDFFEGLVERYAEIAGGDGDGIARFRAMVQHGFSLLVDDHAAVVMIQNESRYLAHEAQFAYLQEFEDNIERLWIGVMQEASKEGSLRPDLDAHLLYRVTRDAIAGASRWYRPKRGRSIDEFADEVADLLLFGAVAPGHRRQPATK
jgi:AcrR family transcriptional regulator